MCVDGVRAGEEGNVYVQPLPRVWPRSHVVWWCRACLAQNKKSRPATWPHLGVPRQQPAAFTFPCSQAIKTSAQRPHFWLVHSCKRACTPAPFTWGPGMEAVICRLRVIL